MVPRDEAITCSWKRFDCVKNRAKTNKVNPPQNIYQLLVGDLK